MVRGPAGDGNQGSWVCSWALKTSGWLQAAEPCPNLAFSTLACSSANLIQALTFLKPVRAHWCLDASLGRGALDDAQHGALDPGAGLAAGERERMGDLTAALDGP